jgi:ribosomal protein S30
MQVSKSTPRIRTRPRTDAQDRVANQRKYFQRFAPDADRNLTDPSNRIWSGRRGRGGARGFRGQREQSRRRVGQTVLVERNMTRSRGPAQR